MSTECTIWNLAFRIDLGKICRGTGQDLPVLHKKRAGLGRIYRHPEVVFHGFCRPEMQQSARKSAVFLVDGGIKAGHDLKKFSLSEEFFGFLGRIRISQAPQEG